MTTLQIIQIHKTLEKHYEDACSRSKECEKIAHSEIEYITKQEYIEATTNCENARDALKAFENHNWD